jgi:hypothetical protein
MSLPSHSRPSTRGEPPRLGTGIASLVGSTSVKTGAQHIARQTKPLANSVEARSLIHGYMVCGLARSPSDWILSTQPALSKAHRTPGSIGPVVQPTILGSIPQHDKDPATIRMFASALKAAFPNDAEVCAVEKAPSSTCHAFVLQLDADKSLYGVALRLWVKSDTKRTDKILEVLEPKDFKRTDSTTLWMPYCLAYLSHYPLFDLMSDYLRCTWMLFGKDPDKFNSNGVLRLTRMPPPQPSQFLRVDLDSYTFCYKMPADSNDFQNFSLWPLWTCISPAQMIAMIEAALSPKGRIVFTSQHPAMLTIACEVIRHYIKTWHGLYVPVVYSGHVQQLLDEPAPYMLGVTKQSRALSSAPRDALVIDLDMHRIYTSRPPGALSPRQRKKYAALLTTALGKVDHDGPPLHLQTAYEQNTRFSAVGSIVATSNTPKAVRDPAWWDPVKVSTVVAHICKRTRQNYKLLSALDTVKNQHVKVKVADLTTMVHDRNNFARGSNDAWDAYIKLKRRTDSKVGDLVTREKELEASVEEHKKEFAELSECTEQLIEDTRQLQKVVNAKTRENEVVGKQLEHKTTHARQLASHVKELQEELREANHTLSVQEEVLSEVERSRDTAKSYEGRWQAVSMERDEAHRAVIHLTSLISGQVSYVERVLASLLTEKQEKPSRPNSRAESRASKRRSFHSLAGGAVPGSPVSPTANMVASRRHTADFSSVVSPTTSVYGGQRSASPLSQVEMSPVGGEDEPSLKDKVGAVAATVRKINQQCIAAIQDLNDKRAELDANGAEDARKEAAATPPPADATEQKPQQQSPSLISRLIEQRGEDFGPQDSDAMSQASRDTKATYASAQSTIPDLESRLSTIRTESAASELRDEGEEGAATGLGLGLGDGSVVKVEPRIQSIEEEDESDLDGRMGSGVSSMHLEVGGKPAMMDGSEAPMVSPI